MREKELKMNPISPLSLTDLPVELLTHICHKLEDRFLGRFFRVCRFLSSLSSASFWHERTVKAFPESGEMSLMFLQAARNERGNLNFYKRLSGFGETAPTLRRLGLDPAGGFAQLYERESKR